METNPRQAVMFRYMMGCGDLWRVISRKFIALSFWQVHRPRIDPGSKVPPVQIRSFGDIMACGKTF